MLSTLIVLDISDFPMGLLSMWIRQNISVFLLHTRQAKVKLFMAGSTSLLPHTKELNGVRKNNLRR